MQDPLLSQENEKERDIEADTVPSKDPHGKFWECFKECEEAVLALNL